jgi:hypothetical protein
VVGEGKAAVVDGGWLTAGPAGTASPTALVRWWCGGACHRHGRVLFVLPPLTQLTPL